MNEIITIQYKNSTPTISARELHKVLGIEKRFSAWFEINSQGFVEGADYSNPYRKVRVQNEGGREVQREVEDYDLALDMAKHICLMSRTEKGKICRQYLIDLEKAWNSPEKVMARALQIANDEMETLKLANTIQRQQIAELTPKASYYDLVLQCPDLVSVTEIAKDYGKSAKWLNKILVEHKIQYKLRGIWILHQKYAKCGYTSTKTNPYSKSDGTLHTKPHTYWTQKGRLFLYEFLKSLGYLPIVEQQRDEDSDGKR